MLRARSVIILLLATWGCSDDSAPGDLARSDAAIPRDGGAPRDGGLAPRDAGPIAADAGGSDASGSDAQSDAGANDAASNPDAAAMDAEGVDASDPVDAGSAGPADPALSGPYTTARVQQTTRVPATGNDLPMDCFYPVAATTVLYPAVLVAHGFQLPASQYTGYAERLATFGYVACTANYRATIVANHVDNATDLLGGIDWLIASSADPQHALSGLVDPARIGLMGHSLGGKVSFLAAVRDPRVAALLGLDPVDSATFCNATRCPDATDMLPLSIPVGVLGETIDASGSLQNCAPAADNFQTFYEASNSPAVEVDVLGANHMSFIDDPSSCGLPCAACNPATAIHADVIALARAFTVAFFERHLRGDAAYDTFLTGSVAQTRYVQTGLVAIRSK